MSLGWDGKNVGFPLCLELGDVPSDSRGWREAQMEWPFALLVGRLLPKVTQLLRAPGAQAPTLSTPIFLKAACSTLKFWMYSCSSLAWNFTFLRCTQPGKSMSMNWQ